MNLNHLAKGTVNALLRTMPLPLLRFIESSTQELQGKGWGASTTSIEAPIALSLLQNAQEDFLIFDVGANIGEWSAAVLTVAPEARIMAFEPSPVASKEYKKKLSRFPNANLFPTALGSTSGRATLYSDHAGSSLASLIRREQTSTVPEFTHHEDVEVTTLDEFCLSNDVARIDVLKMDVEGNELDVLLGAKEMLPNIEVIQFEFGAANIDSRTFFRDYFNFLTQNGFELYCLGPRGLSQVNKYSETLENFRTTNYFAKRKAA